jgi:oxygen-dependent protoporphyrinogen oxidase
MSSKTTSSNVFETPGPAHHVVVVGGGISGLASAWYLQKQAVENDIQLRVTVLEASDRWGGKILTDTVKENGTEPFIVEAGPDSFLTQKPWALALTKELGLDARLLDTNDQQRKVFVVKKGKALPLPDGVMMIIPTEFWPFIASPLISWPGKLRMGLDFFIPPKTDGKDETIAEFVSRRLGIEAVDRLAEPLMSGIYNAEADRQSVLATFPRFRDVEAKYGSLIRGMVAARKARKDAPKPKHAMFVSLKTGTRELVDTLVSQLDADLRLNSPVVGIQAAGEGYEIELSSGDLLYADALVMATPAFVTADLLREMLPEVAERLEAIRYVSTGTLSLAYNKNEISHPLDGFGLVIPVSENRRINAVTWTSTKFNHRAPEGYALLRVFFGGSRRPEMMEKSNDEVLRIVREELADLMGIAAEPVFYRLYRWFNSNPQYDSGHLKLMDQIEEELPPGLYLAGSAYRGIGIPDCIHQAQRAAERVIAQITETASV